MGRISKKENKTVYQSAREQLHLSREEAGALLALSHDRIEKIESEKSLPHPDEVLAMAKKYRNPSLCNHYCAKQCPIGQEYVPEVKISENLSQTILEMVVSLNAVNEKKNRLMEITLDGKIDRDEMDDFLYIQKELERISITVETLQLWVERKIANGEIDRAAYREALIARQNP